MYNKFGRDWTGPFPFTVDGVEAQAKKTAPNNGKNVFTDYARLQELKDKGLIPKDLGNVKWGPYSGVYMILYMKEPVYIGIGRSSVFTRLRKHAKGRGNRQAGKRSGHDDYEFVYWLCDAQSAEQIESHVTVTDKPGFNNKVEYMKYIANITLH